jgi:hypothetical protein
MKDKIISLIESNAFNGLILLVMYLIPKILIARHRKSKDYTTLNVTFKYWDYLIKLDVLAFDGYNYVFKLKIDGTHTMNSNLFGKTIFEPVVIHISSSDVHLLDIVRMTMFSYNDVHLSEKTTSNIIKILTNNGIIK